MPVVFEDLFEEAAVTPLGDHTPDTGSGWTALLNTAATAVIQVKPSGASGTADVVGPSTSENSVAVAYGIVPAPATADVTLEATRYMNNWDVGNSYSCGMFARASNAGGWSGYFVQMVPNAHGDPTLRLYKLAAGSATLLGSYDHTFASGDVVTFECHDAGKRVLVNGVERIASADNAITGAGEAGLYWGNWIVSGHLRAEMEFGSLTVSTPDAGGGFVDLAGSAAGSSAASGTLTVSGGGPSVTFAWQVLIDWAGDGSFSHPLRDVSADWTLMNWRLGFREAFASMSDEAEAQIELLNTDGRYNPDNTTSPLWGKVRPNRQVRIRALVNGVPRTMYTGQIEGVHPVWPPGSGDYAGKNRVLLDCVGFKQRLEETDYDPPVFHDVPTHNAISYVCNELGVPIELLEGGKTVIPYYGVGGTEKAWETLRQITEAERGRLFQGRNGGVRFWNRHHLLLNTTVTATVDYTGDYKPYDLYYDYGVHISNKVQVQVHPHVAQGLETLWTLDSPVYVPANGTRTFYATLRRANGQFAAAAVISASGAVWSQGSAAIALAPKGGRALVTLTNSSATPATLTALTISGHPVVAQNALSFEAQDSGSVAAYGVRGERQLDLVALGDLDEARQIALYELRRRGLPDGGPETVTFRREADGVDNAHLLAWEIGTRITIDVPANGPPRDYFIIGEEHYLSGALHETIYSLEPADPQQYWLLGVAGFGELGQTTRVAY